jgi:hypothetical protein
MKIGKRVRVHRSKLVPTREGEVSRDKVDLAIYRIKSEGLVRILKGYLLPNGNIKIAGGHHLLVALKEIGYDGLIDVQLYDECSPEEFGRMYLTDNSAIDNNCLRWAIHAVSHPAELLGPDYKGPDSQIEAKLAKLMSIRPVRIKALVEMAAALEAKTLAPEVKDISAISHGVYFWKQVKDRGMIPVDDQREYLVNYLLPRLKLDAPEEYEILEPERRIRIWASEFGPDYNPAFQKAKPGKFSKGLSLTSRADKVRMGLEDCISIINASARCEMIDEVQDALRAACAKFVQLCDGGSTEVSNG